LLTVYDALKEWDVGDRTDFEEKALQEAWGSRLKLDLEPDWDFYR
jgi:hypothetical protein